jgi:GNAT superfamily N-acetyltransferase
MQESEYHIVEVEHPEQEVWGIIGRSLDSYNKQQAGDEHAQRIGFVVQAEGGEIAGGVIAALYWDWLYIDLMWVKDELRGRGFGHRLLDSVEEEALKRGARHVYLDTFSFQAPEFYKQHGYRVFGELKEFPPGHQRYFMTKDF